MVKIVKVSRFRVVNFTDYLSDTALVVVVVCCCCCCCLCCRSFGSLSWLEFVVEMVVRAFGLLIVVVT